MHCSILSWIHRFLIFLFPLENVVFALPDHYHDFFYSYSIGILTVIKGIPFNLPWKFVILFDFPGILKGYCQIPNFLNLLPFYECTKKYFLLQAIIQTCQPFPLWWNPSNIRSMFPPFRLTELNLACVVHDWII